MENWGSEWIVFPNAVYGSAANFAGAYGYAELFDKFDYTIKDNGAWDMYQ
jgi:predicted secreted acid phosphatase